jgi:hypothetical protein
MKLNSGLQGLTLTHNSTRPQPQVCSTLPRRGAVAKRSRAQVATTPRPRAGNAKSTTLRVAAFVPFSSRYHLPPARQRHRLIETRRAPAFVSNAKFSAIPQKISLAFASAQLTNRLLFCLPACRPNQPSSPPESQKFPPTPTGTYSVGAKP